MGQYFIAAAFNASKNSFLGVAASISLCFYLSLAAVRRFFALIISASSRIFYS